MPQPAKPAPTPAPVAEQKPKAAETAPPNPFGAMKVSSAPTFEFKPPGSTPSFTPGPPASAPNQAPMQPYSQNKPTGGN